VKRLLSVFKNMLSIPMYIIPFRKKRPGRMKFSIDSLKAAIIPKIRDKSLIAMAALTMAPRKQKTTP
jgi:hypothetical protein